MKNLTKSLIVVIFSAGLLGLAEPVLAATPILSASSIGGNSIQISINNANPNSPINLFGRQTSTLWTEVSNIGQTSYSGNFNQTVNWSSDGSNNPLQLYVTVGGSQSGTVSVYLNGNGNNCYNNNYYNCGGSGSLSLSQTNVNLTSGQSLVVSAYTNGSSYNNNIYVSSNSNSSVASASVNGNQVTIYGNSSGSTTIALCLNGNSSVCSSVYVTVNNGSCYSNNCGSGSLQLSQTSLTLSSGQSQNVTAYNSGSYLYISSNSNSSVASASVNSNQINIYAQSSGSTNIIVCAGNQNTCSTIYVTVNGNNSGSISLNPSTLNLTSPQTATVTIYNPNNIYGNYYVSSNSNANIANASVSGNILNVQSLVGGTTTITVCQSSNSACASLYVTVNGGSCYNNCGSGSLQLSQSNLGLNVGQSSTVTAYNYNGSSLYISNNSNPNAVSATVSGSTITLYGLNSGSSTINICSNNYGQCASLYVTVNINNGSTFYLSQSSVSLGINQSTNVIITGGSGSYYVSSNSNSGVVNAYVSGNTLYLTGTNSGYSTISVCQNGNAYQCATVGVSVNGGNCYNNNCGNGNGSVSFSQSNTNLSVGQNSYITISGSGSYYVSSNTNSYVATASISGNQLTIYGAASGNDTINVCQNNGGCGSVYVTVNSCYYSNCYNNNSNSISLNPASLNLSTGQSQTVTISGSGSYYVSSNSNPSMVSASVSGSSLYITANQSGSATITVCQNSYNACASLYVTVSGGGLQYPGGSVLGASTFPNGELISQNGTVYIVYQNTQTGFSSAAVFRALGFSFSNVVVVNNSGLTNSGYAISNAYAAHPWGSWIKSGSTVYFVSQSGLIPVPNWNTFLNNGGQAAWIVPANSWDFQLPILSPMAYNDSRLL